MGWVTDDGQHEGRDAAVFPDGRFSVGSGSGGVLVRYLDRARDTGDPDLVDGTTVVGWRGVCECGWRGPLWERVTDPMEHQPRGARKLYVPDPGRYADTPGGIDDEIYFEWRGHLPPRALADVREAAEDVRKAQARLDDAVQRARGDGISWADIGDAAGMTRQSAHERWARAGSWRGKRVSEMTDDEIREMAGAQPED
jgi:hypothetical protein